MAGSGFSYGLLAAGVLALLARGLDSSGTEPAPQAPAQPALVSPASQQATAALPANESGAVTLTRAPDGHFYADARVNGTPVRFLVDTGASGVVLTRADARRAGIGSGDLTAQGMGAGGPVKLQPVVLPRLALGTVSADNVPAMVVEDGLPVSLLGQSFISRWREVTIAGDRLTMR